MNQERKNEVRARNLVEHVTSLSFEHSDKTGGVDYLSRDGAAALEVTRFTDEKKRGVQAAYRKKSKSSSLTSRKLRSCWILMVPEERTRIKNLVRDVLPAVVCLDINNETRFVRDEAKNHVWDDESLSSSYRFLLDSGVERPCACEDRSPEEGHIHRLYLSLTSGGGAGDSSDALQLLENELNDRQDNFDKLSAVEAKQCHLFIWVDDYAPHTVSRLFAKSASSLLGEGRFPSRPPRLDPIVTHLWVVGEESGQGWLWDGALWSRVSENETGKLT